MKELPSRTCSVRAARPSTSYSKKCRIRPFPDDVMRPIWFECVSTTTAPAGSAMRPRLQRRVTPKSGFVPSFMIPPSIAAEEPLLAASWGLGDGKRLTAYADGAGSRNLSTVESHAVEHSTGRAPGRASRDRDPGDVAGRRPRAARSCRGDLEAAAASVVAKGRAAARRKGEATGCVDSHREGHAVS